MFDLVFKSIQTTTQPKIRSVPSSKPGRNRKREAADSVQNHQYHETREKTKTTTANIIRPLASDFADYLKIFGENTPGGRSVAVILAHRY